MQVQVNSFVRLNWSQDTRRFRVFQYFQIITQLEVTSIVLFLLSLISRYQTLLCDDAAMYGRLDRQTQTDTRTRHLLLLKTNNSYDMKETASSQCLFSLFFSISDYENYTKYLGVITTHKLSYSYAHINYVHSTFISYAIFTKSQQSPFQWWKWFGCCGSSSCVVIAAKASPTDKNTWHQALVTNKRNETKIHRGHRGCSCSYGKRIQVGCLQID